MTNEQLKERHDLIDTLNGITDKDSFLMQIGNVFDEFEVTHTGKGCGTALQNRNKATLQQSENA